MRSSPRAFCPGNTQWEGPEQRDHLARYWYQTSGLRNIQCTYSTQSQWSVSPKINITISKQFMLMQELPTPLKSLTLHYIWQVRFTTLPLVSHWTQAALSWVEFLWLFNPTVLDLFPIQTLLLTFTNLLLQLTFYSELVKTTSAGRGDYLTIKVKMGRNKLLSFSTYMVAFLMRTSSKIFNFMVALEILHHDFIHLHVMLTFVSKVSCSESQLCWETVTAHYFGLSSQLNANWRMPKFCLNRDGWTIQHQGPDHQCTL